MVSFTDPESLQSWQPTLFKIHMYICGLGARPHICEKPLAGLFWSCVKMTCVLYFKFTAACWECSRLEDLF
eukprot:g6198.t1